MILKKGREGGGGIFVLLKSCNGTEIALDIRNFSSKGVWISGSCTRKYFFTAVLNIFVTILNITYKYLNYQRGSTLCFLCSHDVFLEDFRYKYRSFLRLVINYVIAAILYLIWSVHFNFFGLFPKGFLVFSREMEREHRKWVQLELDLTQIIIKKYFLYFSLL